MSAPPVAAPRRKRPTLRTIADLTGLSLSTVSLSLRDGGALREETRRRVAEAAAQLGYVPDRAGVRLRTGKTNVVALVLDGAGDSLEFAGKLILGIGAGMRGTRYHLTVTPQFAPARSLDAVRYILENRSADGVILTHTGPRDARVGLLLDNDFPFVTHGRTMFAAPHAFHDFNSEAFAERAVARLAAKGCRDVVLLIGDPTTNNFRLLVGAFERAARRLGVAPEVVATPRQPAALAEMQAFGGNLAEARRRPIGIVCDHEIRAVAIISGLERAGLVLGRDVHLICKQTGDAITTLYPALDTIEEDVLAAGRELAQLLTRRIEGEPPDRLQTLAEPVLHWRG